MNALAESKATQMESNFNFTGGFSTVAVASVLVFEMILALIANCTVLSITLYQRKSWKQSSTIFFTSLILAHLVLDALYLPLTIIALAAGEWIFGSTDEEKIATCYFAAFIFWGILLIVLMTVAAISFDRFLFIVKPHLHKRFMGPWVALTLTITIWLLSVPLSSTPFYGLGIFHYVDWIGSCFPVWISIDYIVYTLLLVLIILSVIIITSVWTFCFTRKFINTQQLQINNLKGNVYASKSKRLFGIFGTMLLVYGVCFTPGIFTVFLIPFVDVPTELFVTSFFCLIFFTVANPVVQSCFRPDIKNTIFSLYQKTPFRSLVTDAA